MIAGRRKRCSHWVAPRRADELPLQELQARARLRAAPSATRAQPPPGRPARRTTRAHRVARTPRAGRTTIACGPAPAARACSSASCSAAGAALPFRDVERDRLVLPGAREAVVAARHDGPGMRRERRQQAFRIGRAGGEARALQPREQCASSHCRSTIARQSESRRRPRRGGDMQLLRVRQARAPRRESAAPIRAASAATAGAATVSSITRSLASTTSHAPLTGDWARLPAPAASTSPSSPRVAHSNAPVEAGVSRVTRMRQVVIACAATRWRAWRSFPLQQGLHAHVGLAHRRAAPQPGSTGSRSTDRLHSIRRRGAAVSRGSHPWLRNGVVARLPASACASGQRQSLHQRDEDFRRGEVDVHRRAPRQRGGEPAQLREHLLVHAAHPQQLADLRHRLVCRPVRNGELQVVRILRATLRQRFVVGVDPVGDGLREVRPPGRLPAAAA